MYTISGFISVLITFEKYARVNNHNVKLGYHFILGRYKDFGGTNTFPSKFPLINCNFAFTLKVISFYFNWETIYSFSGES